MPDSPNTTPKEGDHVSLTSDEAKALRQLIALFDRYPNATGLSHLTGLLIRDVLKPSGVAEKAEPTQEPVTYTTEVFHALNELEGARNALMRESNMTNSRRWNEAKSLLIEAAANAGRSSGVAHEPVLFAVFDKDGRLRDESGVFFGPRRISGREDDARREAQACAELYPKLAPFTVRLLYAAPVPAAEPRPDAHPEDFCQECGRPNVTWFAPSPVWNAVLDPSDERESILCPVCFVQRAEKAGIRPPSWKLEPEVPAAEPRKSPYSTPGTPSEETRRDANTVPILGVLNHIRYAVHGLDDACLLAVIRKNVDTLVPPVAERVSEDTARIDWLDAHGSYVSRVVGGNPPWEAGASAVNGEGYGNTAREALDAARSSLPDAPGEKP